MIAFGLITRAPELLKKLMSIGHTNRDANIPIISAIGGTIGNNRVIAVCQYGLIAPVPANANPNQSMRNNDETFWSLPKANPTATTAIDAVIGSNNEPET